jgi:SAM-dependent methyltransferase
MFHPRSHVRQREEYKSGNAADIPIIRVLNEFVLSVIDSFPDATGKTLLDAGCGRQPFRKQIGSKGFHYSGLDVNQNLEGTVDFVCAIDETLPPSLLQQSPFDVICCFEVMEHVANWDMAFANFSTLMKSGSKLILTAPHFFYLHEEPYDFWRPTIHAFDYFAKKHGLTSVDLKKGGSAWDVLSLIISTSLVYSKKRTFINRLKGFMIRNGLRWVNKQILSGTIYEQLTIDSPLYLTNLIILEK